MDGRDRTFECRLQLVDGVSGAPADEVHALRNHLVGLAEALSPQVQHVCADLMLDAVDVLAAGPEDPRHHAVGIGAMLASFAGLLRLQHALRLGPHPRARRDARASGVVLLKQYEPPVAGLARALVHYAVGLFNLAETSQPITELLLVWQRVHPDLAICFDRLHVWSLRQLELVDVDVDNRILVLVSSPSPTRRSRFGPASAMPFSAPTALQRDREDFPVDVAAIEIPPSSFRIGLCLEGSLREAVGGVGVGGDYDDADFPRALDGLAQKVVHVVRCPIPGESLDAKRDVLDCAPLLVAPFDGNGECLPGDFLVFQVRARLSRLGLVCVEGVGTSSNAFIVDGMDDDARRRRSFDGTFEEICEVV
mmetsp:Transcript_110156/g.310604  ORF Transcript_110156/g.310604 Transcript_110156/m.310604 type:complete len:365 (-) Transcript_110156:1579-2673(-)